MTESLSHFDKNSANERRPLTSRQRKLLRDAAGIVLAGEWPWEPEKAGDRQQLEDAQALLLLQPACAKCAEYRERIANIQARQTLNNQMKDRCVTQIDELRRALRDLLPLADEYLKNAPSHPDQAKLETARGLL